MNEVCIDNNLDLIIHSRISTNGQIGFAELNNKDCHTNCDGCFVPMNEF
jgi:hypothetical protein